MDDPDPLSIIIISIVLVVLLMLSACFSAAETAVLSLNKIRLSHLAKTFKRKGKILEKIRKNPAGFLNMVLLADNVVNSSASACATWLAMSFFGNAGVGIATGGLTFILLITGEITPKKIARERPEQVVILLAPVVSFFMTLFTPVFKIVGGFQLIVKKVFRRKSKPSHLTEEDLKLLIEVGEEEGVLEADEKNMLKNVFEFSDLTAKEIMTPRIDIETVELNDSYKDIIQLSKMTTHSRFPVIDEDIDHILGVVYIKDFLLMNGEKEDFSVKNIMRPIHFVFEGKSISQVEQELISSKQNMAVVIDEYGGTAGIVTIEDIVEEVVGSISDEYDRTERPEYDKYGKDAFTIDGGLRLSQVEELTGLNLSKYESDTAAGLVMEECGEIPVKGQKVSVGDWIFEVTEISAKRIVRIKLYPETGDRDG